jgi:hypothetical protein
VILGDIHFVQKRKKKLRRKGKKKKKMEEKGKKRESSPTLVATFWLPLLHRLKSQGPS